MQESEATLDRADEGASHEEPGALTAFAPEPLADANAPSIPDGTTVLHIGDSFAGALGLALNQELAARNVRSVLRYKTASYIPSWAFSREIPRYLARSNPDLVLITLGANELDIPEPGQRARQVRRLIDQLGGVPCVWIAPPLWPAAREKHALLQIIRESCAPCRYLDSTALVGELPRLRDGIHPSTEGREMWAKAVLDWLARERDPAGARPWSLKAEVASETTAAAR
ncbi:MAG TPA: SGNH/GDSL hydrolase family protein [Polyangiaceae bacterium]